LDVSINNATERRVFVRLDVFTTLPPNVPNSSIRALHRGQLTQPNGSALSFTS